MNEKYQSMLSKTLKAVTVDLKRIVLPAIESREAGFSARMAAELIDYICLWLEDNDNSLKRLCDFVDDDRRSDVIRETPVKLKRPLESDQRMFSSEAERLRELQKDAFMDRNQMEIELTEEAVTAYMTVSRPDGIPGTKVERVARIPGGFSKDTHMIDVAIRSTNGTRETLSLVSRRDLPFGPNESSVVREFDLLTKLSAFGFPVPEPIVREPNPDPLGQPFVIMRRVSGTCGTKSWDRDPDIVASIVNSLAVHMGQLHTFTPEQLGLSFSGNSAQDAVCTMIEEWRDRWLCYRVHPSSTLKTAFRWLLDNIPQDIPRISLVHADIGFHNVLVHENRIAAILDWEFFHLGDAMEDLCYTRSHIEKLYPWKDFIKAYENAGGISYREKDSTYYEVWAHVRNAVCCSTAWHGFLSGAYPATKMAYQGIVLYRKFITTLGDLLFNKVKEKKINES